MTQPQSPRYCTSCGSPLVSPEHCSACGNRHLQLPHAQQPALAPAPVRARLLPPGRRWVVVTIAAVLGLALLGATLLVVVVVFPAARGPEDTVRAYFDALAARDAGDARALLAGGAKDRNEGDIAGVSAGADLSLLAEATLRSSDYTPPRKLEIEGADAQGGSATVRISYDFGGHRTKLMLPLSSRRTLRGQRSWRISDGLLELSVGRAVTERVLVAGATVRIPSTGSLTLVAFPGAYRVRLADHPLFESEAVTVFAGSKNVVSPAPATVRPNVRQEVVRQINTALDECARSTQLAPPNCPFAGAQMPVTSITWRIVRYPKVDMKVAEGGETLLVFTPGEYGLAAMTAVWTETGRLVTWDAGFVIEGTVRAVDGKPVFSLKPRS